MQIRTFEQRQADYSQRSRPPTFGHWLIDPLDVEQPGEQVMKVTARSLVRLALVASEAGARFAREGTDQDPMAWLVAPRRLFGGRAAVEACLGRDDCLRAVLLHGLSIGLDADPAEIDALSRTEEPGVDDGGPGESATSAGHSGGEPRLWTSSLVAEGVDELIHLFDAVVAETRDEAVERLCVRHGRDTAFLLDVREGFDETAPLVEALVSPAVADMLRQVAAAPASPLARGLSVSVEQRFEA